MLLLYVQEVLTHFIYNKLPYKKDQDFLYTFSIQSKTYELKIESMVEMVDNLNVNRMLLTIPHTRGEPWYLY